MRPDVYICDAVRAVRDLHADVFDKAHGSLSIREQLDRQAQCLFEGHAARHPAAHFHLANWHPSLVSAPAERIFGTSIEMSDARETMAREYGYVDWAAVLALGDARTDSVFETAVDAALRGDLAVLAGLVEQHAGLSRARSAYGHRATILLYLAANGVETHRQVVSTNVVEVMRLLLGAGAEINARASVYGCGATTLGLVETSCHPVEAGMRDAMVDLLVAHGATGEPEPIDSEL